MTAFTTIQIHTEKPYPVMVGRGLLARCGELLSGCAASCTAFLVSDDTVAALYADTVLSSLEEAGFSVIRHTFPHGEQSKNTAALVELVNAMAGAGLTRSDLAVALGGGVTGDLTGFAASVYLRGIPYVQMPTTVLAAVDAAVGGKTGVDLPAGKNLMGSFWQPTAVFCDCETFDTLPDDVFADGLAEAVKAAVLCDPALFERLEQYKRGQDLTDLVARCIHIKETYVVKDETDRGRRQFLNLGHTPAHAIERCSGYRISHGRAVAAGLAIMARASERLGYAKQPFADRIGRLLCGLGLPDRTAYSAAELAEAALADKKRRGENITLVMPREIGSCELMAVPVDRLERIFEAGCDGYR